MNKAYEINFDSIIGPTHYYGGFSEGNIASMIHKNLSSNPKKAALEGLEKMKFLFDLGLKQAVLPPHDRPDIDALRSLGFQGNDLEVLESAHKEDPTLFYLCCTASSMWAANAATISPSVDSSDHKVHVTPANLASMFHRSIEAKTTAAIFKAIFHDSRYFVHHPPLPYPTHFSDEGAANQTRLCPSYHDKGLHLFVFGRSAFQRSLPSPSRFPARQSLEASQTIAREHHIPDEQILFAQQNPKAIDAGIFHNDVISTGNKNLFLYHEEAFLNTSAVIESIQEKFQKLTSQKLICIQVDRQILSLEEAVNSYLFNSQIISLPDDSMAILAPHECTFQPNARLCLDSLLSNHPKIFSHLYYTNVEQSMQNGGGPACLRLRIVLTEAELQATHPHVFFTETLYHQLKEWICTHYRDRLTPADLRDSNLLKENRRALDQLTRILHIGSLYTFQN